MKVKQDYHHRAKELGRGLGGDSSGGFDAELSTYGRNGKVLGVVVGAYGETSDDAYVIAEAVAEELTTEHWGFYSDKRQGVVAAFFLSQIYRPWGLTARHRWVRLMLDRRCLVEVPNAPTGPSVPTPKPNTTRRPPSTATSALRPATGPGQRAQLMPRRRPALYIA